MLPSAYVKEVLGPRDESWYERAQAILERLGMDVTAHQLQRELVRQFLLDEEMVRIAMRFQLGTYEQRWFGSSMLVQIDDSLSSSGLLLLEADPPEVRLDVPFPVKLETLLRARTDRWDVDDTLTRSDNEPSGENALSSFLQLTGPDFNPALTNLAYEHSEDDRLRQLIDILPLDIALVLRPDYQLTVGAQSAITIGDTIAGSGGSVTAGVPAQLPTGERGFLTALHGLESPGRTGKYSDGRHGIVGTCKLLKNSNQWDAALLRHHGVFTGGLSFANVLDTRAPLINEQGEFDGGAQPARQSAKVDAVDPILPHIGTSHCAMVGRFYTDRVTDPGDSGAYLVLNPDIIAGQAFARSAGMSPVSYSIWTWMEGIRRSLRVDLISP